MEFKKYKMAMRNRISPKNRDFVIDRERAPFDDNVSNLGEQPVFSQNEFTTTPMIDPAEFPARKEYMQSYAVGGNVRQLFGIGGLTEAEYKLLEKNLTKEELKQISKKASPGSGSSKDFYGITKRKNKSLFFKAQKILNPNAYLSSELGKINNNEKLKNLIIKYSNENKSAAEIFDLIKNKYPNIRQTDIANYAFNSPDIKPEFKRQTLGQQTYSQQDIKKFENDVSDIIKDIKAKNNFDSAGKLSESLGVSPDRLKNEIIKQEGKKFFNKNFPTTSDVGKPDKQKLIIEYILKNENPKLADIKKIVKEFDFERFMGNFVNNIYRHQSDPDYAKFLNNFDFSELQDVSNKLGNIKGFEFDFQRAMGRLLANEIDDPIKYRQAMNKLKNFYTIRNEVSKKYPKLNLVLDHPIPYTYLKNLKLGGDAVSLIRVNPLPDLPNRLKASIDKEMIRVGKLLKDNPNNPKLLKQLEKLEEVKNISPFNFSEVEKFDDLDLPKSLQNMPEKYNDAIKFSRIINKDKEIQNLFKEANVPTSYFSKTAGEKLIPEKQVSEINDYVKSLSDDLLGIVGCSNSDKLQPRSKLTRTENSVGGRIGFANGPKPGNGCIEKGKKKLEEGRIGKAELNAVEKSLTDSGKMTPAAQKFFTAAKTALKTGSRIPAELISLGFGPYGVIAGALLELATVQDQIRRGNLKQAWRETFPGMILKGAENLAGIDLTGSRRTDIIKYAETDEEIAAVNAMYKYSEGVKKYNEMLGDLDLIGGDILANEQLQEPEADLMTYLSSQQFYDVEDKAKKLNELLDFQEKIATSPEVQKLANMPIYREAKDKFKIAQEFYPNLTFEEFLKGESGDAYYNEGEPQYNKFVAPNIIIDPDTEFMRQPFAGGGLSIQDKIQELLASIPGLMIADFVPVSEKVQLKRLFDQFNDRYMRKAEGGRIGFKNGPEDINKSRRLFSQLLLGLAALPVVGKYLKLGRGAGKVANITINKTAGMPEFFEPLVNKVINEGIDITQKMSTQERQIVHMADIANHEVTVYRQLDTGEIDVYINGMKTLYQDAVRLYYKPGQISEEASKAAGKPIKEADEFIAQESSPAYSGSPEDYEITSDGTFETNNFNELASDLTEVEAAVMKQPVTELQKRKKLDRYKYYESKEGQQKLLDEQYGEYDDTMRDDIIDE
jgi:hypothetical protein